MSGTQWRQEKEVTREKLDRLAEMKESAVLESSWWKEMLAGAWCLALLWETISWEMSTPTTSPGAPAPPRLPSARAAVVSPVPQPKSSSLKWRRSPPISSLRPLPVLGAEAAVEADVVPDRPGVDGVVGEVGLGVLVGRDEVHGSVSRLY